MKVCTTVIITVLGASVAFGDQLTDDFNRADTTYSTNGAMIGMGWNTSEPDVTGEVWRVSSNEVQCDIIGATDPAILYNAAVPLDSEFTCSADVKLQGAYGGIVFNYQNATNYYVARIRGWGGLYQILRVVNGETHTVLSETTAPEDAFSGTNYYTLAVTSDNAYNFTLEITKRGESLVLNPVTNATDAAAAFAGGYAGLYCGSNSGSPDTRFDNFNVQTAIQSSTQVVDYFFRADTAYSTNGTLIGADWHTSEPGEAGEQWRIQSNQLECDVTGATDPAILYNTAVALDTNFTYSADVKLHGAYGGIVFHYQDANNYYAARIRSYGGVYQILRVVDGGVHTIINQSNPTESFVGNQYYTFTVTSDNAYNFTLEITKQGQSEVLNPVTNATDAASAFTGGYAGMYCGSNTASPDTRFDNFNLAVMGAGPTGYDAWAAGWGVDIGAEGDDYDEDGLANLYEYGLGGNPINPLDQGTSPEFGVANIGGINWFGYVHPQLSDPDSGLDYHLELTDDLAGGAWTNAGYTVTGTNVTGSTLDLVTNVTDTVAGSKFIRLVIESL